MREHDGARHLCDGADPRDRHGNVRAMVDRVIRAALAALAIVSLSVGLWAAFSPRSFYEHFPGGGRVWVAADGPFNEHLVRDVGELNLALTVVTGVALVTLGRAVVLAAAGAWLVYSAPHLVYHARHLDVYDTSDQVATIGALVLALVLPTVVVVAELRRAPDRPGSGYRR
jgi:hypothetical protein